MPTGPRLPAVPTWTIRSLAVRTRDGSERLDQAYHRLLNDAVADKPPLDSDKPAVAAVISGFPNSRR